MGKPVTDKEEKATVEEPNSIKDRLRTKRSDTPQANKHIYKQKKVKLILMIF